MTFWRPIAATGVVSALLALACYTMWLQDWQWGLPTARPANLEQPAVGSVLAIPASIAAAGARSPGRPLFLHFFNPDCPCSRFSRDHVLALIRAHRDDTTFVAVIEPEGGPINPQAAAIVTREFGIPAVVDEGGLIAKAVGVYSTPQAVVVHRGDALYFRGNYNLARYCTDEKTEFARLALEHALAGAPVFHAPREALVAYGCPLPPREVRLDAERR